MGLRTAPYDVALRNGTVVDGTGRPRFISDVAVKGDRIAAIGDLRDEPAELNLDVSGLIVAPGFIDVHSHDDASLISTPRMLPKLTQGVTTVIGGNCGISGAPFAGDGSPPDLLRMIFKEADLVASSFGEFLRKVENARPSTNAAFLTGHTTLRLQVMGTDANRAATSSEISAMRELLTECLEQGSLGLSTGLFYSAARAATADEIIGIARPLSEYNGICTSHVRDEADAIVESLQEALHIGDILNVPLVVSHHKCMGPRNFGRSVETLELLRRARERQRVAWDVYPYTAASTLLNQEMVELSLRVVISWSDPHPELCGQELDEISRRWGCTPVEAIPRLCPAGAVYFTMAEEDVTRIVSSPEAMIGSDGMPADDHPHPRLWGAFSRVLGRYVRERNVVSLERAVHQMTGLSARTFGLLDRGSIEMGKYADLCVFDPNTILDTATFETPISPSAGVRLVLVNGCVALKDGVPSDVRAGRVLRRSAFMGHSGPADSVELTTR